MTAAAFAAPVTGISTPQYSCLTITGTAANPTSKVVDGASVNCIVRSGGTIVGGATAYLDTMVSSGEIAWTATAISKVDGDTAECAGSFYDYR